ncbi:MAG: OmpH family outer membrane protein [Alloprevotella sp.]|nr:OmpH family outer membrane protein [Alloprevotella sp.]
MKKTIILTAIITGLVGCNKDQKENVKPNDLPKAEQPSAKEAKGGVAYVEIDSLATGYQFCVEQQEELQKKQQGYAAQLQKEGKAFETAAENFQKKLQEGKFSSEQEARNAQAALQKQQQTIAQHEAQYNEAMAKATTEYQQELKTRINKFLTEYNKNGRFSLVLTNSEAAINVLYAEPALDITKDVIEGLNKEYKK